MSDSQDNPFAGILGSNVLAPPSDIAGALQGLMTPEDGRMQQLRGGLAAGLTAAANNWNKPALAAFAGGAGGALQGANQAAQQQTDNRLKAVQAALQAWQAGDIPGLRRAQADYYRALAQRAAMPQPGPPVPSPGAGTPAAPVTPSPTNPGFGPPAIEYGSRPTGTPQAAPPAASSPMSQPAAAAVPPSLPAGVPFGAAFSPSRNQWRTSDGRFFDMTGNEVPLSDAGTSQPSETA